MDASWFEGCLLVTITTCFGEPANWQEKLIVFGSNRPPNGGRAHGRQEVSSHLVGQQGDLSNEDGRSRFGTINHLAPGVEDLEKIRPSID